MAEIIEVLIVDDEETLGFDEGIVDIDLDGDPATANFLVKHLSPAEYVVSGTGNYQPFLNLNAGGGPGNLDEEGFNTDAPLSLDAAQQQNTNAIHLANLPTVIIDGVAYYEIRLDVNEPNNADFQLSLSEFQIFTSGRQATAADYNAGNDVTALGSDFVKVFDLDQGVDRTLILADDYKGSGRDDYIFYIPVSAIPPIPGTDPFITLYAKFGPTPPEDGGFEEFRLAQTASIDVLKSATVTHADGSAPSAQVLAAGDVIHYTITVENTGTMDLTGVAVTDALEGAAAVPLTLISGDADMDGKLDASETWTYGFNYVVTQADIDGKAGGDGTFFNVATADTAQTPPDSDDETVPVLYNPDIAVTKTFDHVDDGADVDVTATTEANGAGDKIVFTIAVKNDGNVTLNAPMIADANAVATAVTAGMFNTGDADQDGLLDVGETWNFLGTHTLTQAEIDARGNDPTTPAADIYNLAIATATPVVLATGPVSAQDDAAAPIVYLPQLDLEKSVTSITNGMAIKPQVNAAGDVINYAITVANTGNVTLTGVQVSDTLADAGTLVRGADVVGNNDGNLDVGETWSFTAAHTVTQPELDLGGNFDGADPDMLFDQFRNVATATSDQGVMDSDDATVDVMLDPKLSLSKTIASIEGGANIGDPMSSADDAVDTAGDKIHYTIRLGNAGNVTLTNVTLTDVLEANGFSLIGGTLPAGFVIDSFNGDGVLNVGETWTLTATYTVSQTDIDTNGGTMPPATGFIDNAADATATFRGATIDVDASDVHTPIVYNPALSIEKQVKDANGVFVNADTPTGPVLANGGPVDFRITIANTGNVTLTGVTLQDVNFTADAMTGTVVSLVGAVRTVTSTDLNATALTLDDNVLNAGETWTYNYTQPFDFGQHKNTATVDTDQTGPSSDDAYYTSMQVGPGVRTPGFWKNLGDQFWDGNATNQTKVGKDFPDHDLLFVNKDGNAMTGVKGYEALVVNSAGKAGLLVGDFNLNGVTDIGEDTIFITRDDAIKFIDASQKDVQDGRYQLSRDVTATWLNYLAGNPLDTGNNTQPGANDPLSAKAYLQDAIDWLQTFGDTDGDKNLEVSDFTKATAIATSNAKWSSNRDYVPGGDDNRNTDGMGKLTDYTGSEMHNALDYYNNNGQTAPGGFHYANDGDGLLAMMTQSNMFIA